jgi:uncharacterized alpha/beta hydrolase family protein
MLNACSLKAINTQSIELKNLAKISGKVIVEGGTTQSIIVAAITLENEKATIISQRRASKNGSYQLHLLSGKYLLGAYIDKNNNLIRDEDEIAAMFSQQNEPFTKIILKDKQTINLATITIDPEKNINNYKKVEYNTNKTKENTGRIVSLDNVIFAKENSDMGLWRPIDFLRTIGGGLMFLQPYDKDKTPVIFIHGISGNPKEFQPIIKQLDQDKFQPWILYYPSGLPLSLISNYTVETLTRLHNKHHFHDIQVISHSMGGLISRDFLRLQQEKNLPFTTSLYITINSPMYGSEDATEAVEKSPIVLASWRDLATNSDYIKSLHQWRIPSEIPYHLFFSYLPGEDGDGTVPMSSQLSLSLQDEAERIYATEGSHAGVLADKKFIKRLTNVIETSNK